jgi:predicted O-methyltransferase YrrM
VRLRDRLPIVSKTEESVANRFPLGHYYSPLPDQRELAREPHRSRLWPERERPIPGVDWNEDEQARLADTFAQQDRLALVDEETTDPTVYWTRNDQYPALDAWALEAMLRYLRPRRMIEIGSGYSSLITARVNREFLQGAMRFVCIEPYPRAFLQAGVPGVSDLRVEEVQNTPLELFERLGDGDVLFIDTSHTVKTGGDVAWIYGEILPRLAPGVVVHIHDAFIPGEYPQEWVMEGWGWNEIYLIKAFLTFNSGYRVIFGLRWLLQNRPELVDRAFPGFRAHRDRGGAALWLRRTQAWA